MTTQTIDDGFFQLAGVAIDQQKRIDGLEQASNTDVTGAIGATDRIHTTSHYYFGKALNDDGSQWQIVRWDRQTSLTRTVANHTNNSEIANYTAALDAYSSLTYA